jgi:hypothetical protein
MNLNRCLLPVVLCFLSAEHLAIGQTQPSKCIDVSPELADIAGALNICDEVGTFSETPVSIQTVTEAGQVRAEARRKVELHYDAAVSQQKIAKLELNGQQTNMLKYSALVIGVLGAGVGGGLHLVNNPHVGHAATVLGISAGVVGGAMNFAALKWGSTKCSGLGREVMYFIQSEPNSPCKDTTIRTRASV